MSPQVHTLSSRPILPPMPLTGGMSGVQLVHLRTPSEIERVLPLRDEIDLSVHAAAGRSFHELEKKEMSWDSSVLSSSTGS